MSAGRCTTRFCRVPCDYQKYSQAGLLLKVFRYASFRMWNIACPHNIKLGFWQKQFLDHMPLRVTMGDAGDPGERASMHGSILSPFLLKLNVFSPNNWFYGFLNYFSCLACRFQISYFWMGSCDNELLFCNSCHFFLQVRLLGLGEQHSDLFLAVVVFDSPFWMD